MAGSGDGADDRQAMLAEWKMTIVTIGVWDGVVQSGGAAAVVNRRTSRAFHRTPHVR